MRGEQRYPRLHNNGRRGAQLPLTQLLGESPTRSARRTVVVAVLLLLWTPAEGPTPPAKRRSTAIWGGLWQEAYHCSLVSRRSQHGCFPGLGAEGEETEPVLSKPSCARSRLAQQPSSLDHEGLRPWRPLPSETTTPHFMTNTKPSKVFNLPDPRSSPASQGVSLGVSFEAEFGQAGLRWALHG